MAAVGTLEAGEAKSEVATAVEVLHDSHGIRTERAVDGTVDGFVFREERGPTVVHNLPEGRGSRAARAVNGWHNCSFEQICRDFARLSSEFENVSPWETAVTRIFCIARGGCAE